MPATWKWMHYYVFRVLLLQEVFFVSLPKKIPEKLRPNADLPVARIVR